MNDWKFLANNTEDGRNLLYKVSAIDGTEDGNIFSAILFKEGNIRAVVYAYDTEHPLVDGDTEGVANSTFDNLLDAREWVESVEFEIQNKWRLNSVTLGA